ncbi:Ger(x)C family spore germination protein [Paenibacillus sp. CGMCC 1.16610]|uniref:Ger(X)C family spore germination protein n=1 Tax=Paenibacillus anseongense TaxID=2682845 RepID=A0ABW9U8P7_9BACL|nr:MULTISPECIES: Ger(x)C family spore germination protein [Paenibacillus]MBA2940609.1 Ger(x)C family spore germination protein [Paenibacillus sp. CGMCC 1.16610]MVQ35786.1 Ger(x)C family spore germination protein [Paenibacillus anseongense]
MKVMLKLFLMASLFTPLLTGCWDRTEVNDLALVTGAAIDKYDDKSIELTIQIFVPRSPGGGGGGLESSNKGGSIQNSLVKSAVGVDIADAVSKIQEKMPRKIFWGHTEIIIFGEAVARQGVRDEVDYLMRAPQPRERAFMYICKGSAREILEMNTRLERNSSEIMREIAKSKIILSVTLADLAHMLVKQSGAAALPFIELLGANTPRNHDDTGSFTNYTAVFKDDKMVGTIDDPTTRGLLWLRDEIKTAVVTVTPEGVSGHVSLRLLKSETKLQPIIENGKWRMNVWIHTEDDALQNTTSLDLASDQQAVKRVEAAMNDDIEERVAVALRKVQQGFKADIFDFAGEFHRAYPKEWRQNQKLWNEIFPNVEVTVQSDARMLRPGLSSIKSSRSQEENDKEEEYIQ